jgi:ribonuclease R
MSSSHFFITGRLSFSSRKIILDSWEVSYFVRTRSLWSEYLHGDIVRARIMKNKDSSRLAEVDILSLVRRTEKILLWQFIVNKDSFVFEALSEQWRYQKKYDRIPLGYVLGDIISFKFDQRWNPCFLEKFASESDFDLEERILFYLSSVRTEFDKNIIEEWKRLEKRHTDNSNLQEKSTDPKRVDFSEWFTLTIDGADAKDLDDAISLRINEVWNYMLAVHIADVAEYVTEWSGLDREAYTRATSIYTPGKVIPMLPESLSNNLCSLHPGRSKLTLSCVMEVDKWGHVKHAEIVESVIVSQHRGIYEDIQKTYDSLKVSNEKKGRTKLEAAILTGYELYEVLQNRRKKEGKILFESTELSFDIESENTQEKSIPKHIHKRTRTHAHKLIEEFMILANEEVAKWCEKNEIPFLSRVHALPGFEQLYLIGQIIGQSTDPDKNNRIISKKQQKSITPGFIRSFLDTITDERELYRLSRLLLPKMAKAQYSDKRLIHFGLALEYYSHFTSPIRRYPDLQIHRIIKEKLRDSLTIERMVHYKNLLKRVARHCSENERAAEDVERVFDSLYVCRYMEDKVGTVYMGRISSVTDFAIFIELDNGVEGTLYLPKKRYILNQVIWSLETMEGKELYKIGEDIRVKIDRVDTDEKRIVLKQCP